MIKMYLTYLVLALIKTCISQSVYETIDVLQIYNNDTSELVKEIKLQPIRFTNNVSLILILF